MLVVIVGSPVDGGSIYILNGGELQLYSCIVSNNKAFMVVEYMHSDSSSSNVKVYAENSILKENSAVW